MKIIGIILTTLTLFATNWAHGGSFEAYISRVYPVAVKRVGEHFPGPVAFELTQVALLRQVHEDGLHREPTICINGMVVGGRNTEVIQSLSFPPEIKISKIRAHDAQLSYKLTGPHANVWGIVAVAKWIDKHILELPSVTLEERAMWERSKRLSYLLTTEGADPRYFAQLEECAAARNALLDKINSKYGPRGRAISHVKKKMRPVFEQFGMLF